MEGSSKLVDRGGSLKTKDNARSAHELAMPSGSSSATFVRDHEEGTETEPEEGFSKPMSRRLEAVVIPVSSQGKPSSKKAIGKQKQLTPKSQSATPSIPSPSKSRRPTSSKLSTPASTRFRQYYEDDNSDSDYSSSDSSHSSEESDVPKRSRDKDSAAKDSMKPTLTPIVNRVVQGFFNLKFRVAELDSGKKPGKSQWKSMKYDVHKGNPEKVEFENELESEDNKVYYKSVILDGERYKIGDIVMVQPGEDARKGRQKNFASDAAQSVNDYANKYWFIRIRYFYEEFDRKSGRLRMFHGQWFEHGSKTFLQQTSHSRALYLTNSCGDAPLSSIYRKCDVKFPKLGEQEEEDDHDSDGDQFFCQYVWDDNKDLSFLDLPSEEQITEDLAFAPAYRACHSCVLEERAEFFKEVQYSKENGCVSHYGIDYHVDDFIYLRPSGKEQSDLLEKAQIVKILPPGSNSSPKLIVRKMNNPERKSNLDEHLLEFSKATETVSFEDVNGKFYVARYSQTSEKLPKWIREDDHFFVDKNTSLSQCSQCLDDHKKLLEKRKNVGPPLRALELFSGAGGLGSGLDASGYVKTVAAVEWDKHAAETYKTNHPQTAVFCQDVNKLLHDISNDENVQSLPRGGKTRRFPRPGDIDLISGGPPCQAFSMANHHPKENDIRATLPFSQLSFTEMYLPPYFLLENVVGILNFRLRGVLKGRSLSGGIKHGVFKLIVRTLMALGYQVHVKVLQAANYGAPQGRQRVIFLAAKQGLKIPDFPIPTHVFRANNHKLLENDDLILYKPTRSPDDSRSFAPFRTVSCSEAIGDLAGFDWENPHRTIKATDKDKLEAKIRSKSLPSFPAGPRNKLPGFETCEYAHSPMNAYQKLVREDMEDEVKEHVTPTFSEHIIECSTTVPLQPRASHLDIPERLHRKKKKDPQPIFYGRLDGNECFKTAMTRCAPNTKASYLLHFSQKRMLTVREYARAQGFPDRYTFMKSYTVYEANLAYKQIGNAVPVPLALALGKSLGDALVVEREREEERERKGSAYVDRRDEDENEGSERSVEV
ncbi:hypothetical protein GYMLUDRAFT_98175 [Collybiopsis luxurians FD-317 M1]|uniref:Cytosine-specific methyltransferase n=1 Tax=Collybiopsis luxurians FD-317 M1 TaxID=944289 RepID=A0A0D0B4K0_9AGAR|nr:hypothetical protein GYMLUDRAFT_98175 [Collybiopsis luxurians FD-317 M1]